MRIQLKIQVQHDEENRGVPKSEDTDLQIWMMSLLLPISVGLECYIISLKSLMESFESFDRCG